jgi:polar amino acid transport system permease protein
MKVWNWEGFWNYLTNLYLLEGALVTIALTVSTLFFGAIIGLCLAVMRLNKRRWVSRIAQGYVWIFRGTPLLVQLIIIYTGLPQLGMVRFTVLESAVIGLALNEAAYLSEILRGGILSVAKGQTEAARALGLKPWQIFRLVVLPQALRVIIPPLGNSVNGLLKTTSIASVISMEEVLRRGQILAMTTCWDLVQRRIEAYYGKAYGAAADRQLARDDH